MFKAISTAIAAVAKIFSMEPGSVERNRAVVVAGKIRQLVTA